MEKKQKGGEGQRLTTVSAGGLRFRWWPCMVTGVAVLATEKMKKGGDGQRLTLVAAKGKTATARTTEVQICGGGCKNETMEL
ncbi:T9SS C-terminal target domain-containing protein [Sesbania bispinosa]|nr:T9SS C-terminal target domain-containing protein [Sesbania bispinosa]